MWRFMWRKAWIPPPASSESPGRPRFKTKSLSRRRLEGSFRTACSESAPAITRRSLDVRNLASLRKWEKWKNGLVPLLIPIDQVTSSVAGVLRLTYSASDDGSCNEIQDMRPSNRSDQFIGFNSLVSMTRTSQRANGAVLLFQGTATGTMRSPHTLRFKFGDPPNHGNGPMETIDDGR
ncbi:hypothetical protein EDB86DRAFT_327295 [Lactarius hatsudake]|nr:hypothetical protein EDB86DRAFT_327295 [Lactarius hatsudake]